MQLNVNNNDNIIKYIVKFDNTSTEQEIDRFILCPVTQFYRPVLDRLTNNIWHNQGTICNDQIDYILIE